MGALQKAWCVARRIRVPVGAAQQGERGGGGCRRGLGGGGVRECIGTLTVWALPALSAVALSYDAP